MNDLIQTLKRGLMRVRIRFLREKLTSAIVAVYLLFPHGSQAQQTGSNTFTSETKQAAAQDAGLMIGLDVPSPHAGGPVMLSISLTNMTEGVLYFVETDYVHDFHIRVEDEHGNLAPFTKYGRKVFLEPQEIFRCTVAKLQPKQEKRYSVSISQLYDLRTLGVYTVSAKCLVSKRIGPPDLELVSNTIKLTILAGQEHK